MNSYYEKFYKTLRLSGKSPRTISSYEYHLHKLEKHYNKTPDKINENELREYLIYFKDEKKYSESFFKQALSSFRYFYEKTCNRMWKTLNFTYPKKEYKLPDVLSTEEVKLILSHVRKPRYHAILFTLYSLGLRILEGVTLCVADIDSSRMLVHVRGGKGSKDRFVPLPTRTLTILRKHWVRHKNKDLIFPSYKPQVEQMKNTKIHMREGAVQTNLKIIVNELNIKKHVSPKTLRHSYATHLLEAGVNLRLIQEYLGHNSPKTTSIYTHLTSKAQQTATKTINQLMSNY